MTDMEFGSYAHFTEMDTRIKELEAHLEDLTDWVCRTDYDWVEDWQETQSIAWAARYALKDGKQEHPVELLGSKALGEAFKARAEGKDDD